MTTITSEIERIETEIQKSEVRLETIDRLRRLKDLPTEEWDALREEKKALEKQLKSQRNDLKGLRWENRKSMLVSVIVLGVFYLVYLFVFASPQTQSDMQR